jgi:hypothetical protein
MLRELPEAMMEGEPDEARWFFETQRKEWEQEQQEEEEQEVTAA